MNKIGVIGGRDSVLGFRALGLDTCIAENGEQAKAALHRSIGTAGVHAAAEKAVGADIL